MKKVALAEQMLVADKGATMDEIIAATGGPQYNVLRKLEARGYRIRKLKEDRATRYWAEPPKTHYFQLHVAPNGQTTLPRPLRDRLGVAAGGKLEAVVEGDRIAIRPKTRSITELFGILHRPGMRARTLEEIEAGIAAGAVESALGRKAGKK
jgi:AbrB family looped-hinge helix DNA binding protein